MTQADRQHVKELEDSVRRANHDIPIMQKAATALINEAFAAGHAAPPPAPSIAKLERERDEAERIVRDICAAFCVHHPDMVISKANKLQQQIDALLAHPLPPVAGVGEVIEAAYRYMFDKNTTNEQDDADYDTVRKAYRALAGRKGEG